MLFQSKQKKIEAQLELYCQKVSTCMEWFQSTIRQHCDHSDRATLKENSARVHAAESQADDIRRDIEVIMYSRALFPESRGDILGLLEAMDRIPNSAESVTRMLVDQHISIPREFSGELWELADLCGRLVEVVLDATRRLMGRFLHATQLLGKIDELESEADRIESRLIERIFAGKRDGYEKLLLRDLIQHIASISDRAQHVGDRINIIVAKRHI